MGSDVELLHHAWPQNDVKIKLISRSQGLKPFSDVAGHVLHSFCAGDRGFKGIVGTVLINSFLQVILFHGTLL